MSLGARYLVGVGTVAVLAAALVGLAPMEARTGAGWGALAGLALQAPLGWWALRAIGTDAFLPVWGLGMLVRFTVIGVAGLAVVPLVGGDAGPVLGSMVGVLVALLAVEGVTALREHSRKDER